MTKYAVEWDNGDHASGVFPQRFETEEAAQAFAEEWVRDMFSEAGEDWTGDAEVIEVNE